MNYFLLGMIAFSVVFLAVVGGWKTRLAPATAGGPTTITAPTGPGPALVVSTLAGQPLPPDYADGQGPAARFRLLGPMATDRQGNLYLGDGQAVRKITPAGLVSTLAGAPPVPQLMSNNGIYTFRDEDGPRDGRGPAAQINPPRGLAVAPDGTVYFSESNTIRRISPQGDVTTWAGNPGTDPGGYRDGPAAQALFDNPTGLALDARGNVYVADMSNHVIRKITPAGMVSTLAGQAREYGGADGAGPAARFDNPAALAVAPDGTLFVADNGNSCIRRVGLDGTVTTWVGTARNVGPGTWPGAKLDLSSVEGMAVDHQGAIYLTINSHGSRHIVRRILPDRTEPVRPWAGNADDPAGPDAATPAGARFNLPEALALGPDGTLYVADRLNNVVRAIAPAGRVTTLAGQLPLATPDGPAATALFNQPTGLVVDPAGTVWVADFGHGLMRRVSAAGVVSTVAGQFRPAAGSGAKPATELSGPAGVALGPGGDLFVADKTRHAVYRVSPSGAVRVWAGRPDAPGDTDDGVVARARFNYPSTIAAAPDGSLYVTDGESRAVRRISPQGRVSTLLKGHSLRVSPLSNEGRYEYPTAVAVGPDGAVYVLQGTLRRFPPGGGLPVLLAGDSEPGYVDGPGTQARFNYPTGLAVDAHGTVFIADRGNHLIRRVSPRGEVSTVAGQVGRHRFAQPVNKYLERYYGPDTSGEMTAMTHGDYRDGPAAQARFNHPAAVAVGADGTLYVADQDNNCIRVIRSAGP